MAVAFVSPRSHPLAVLASDPHQTCWAHHGCSHCASLLRTVPLPFPLLPLSCSLPRFLYRLGPFKARTCAGLCSAYGFEASTAGFQALERACYAHLADDPAVGSRAKALARDLMGDVWEPEK
jgi:hypothetical protein